MIIKAIYTFNSDNLTKSIDIKLYIKWEKNTIVFSCIFILLSYTTSNEINILLQTLLL